MSVVIAIDPGRDKCGVAVASERGVLHRSIRPPAEIPRLIAELIAEYSAETIIIGDGTSGRELAEHLRGHTASAPVEFVDESHSTLRARSRFFQENPPRGLRRLIPRGLLTPNRPIDDLAAVILAEEYLGRR